MTVIHILIDMFKSRSMQSNGTTKFKYQSRHVLRNNVSRHSSVPHRMHAEQWYVITFDVTWKAGVSHK